MAKKEKNKSRERATAISIHDVRQLSGGLLLMISLATPQRPRATRNAGNKSDNSAARFVPAITSKFFHPLPTLFVISQCFSRFLSLFLPKSWIVGEKPLG